MAQRWCSRTTRRSKETWQGGKLRWYSDVLSGSTAARVVLWFGLGFSEEGGRQGELLISTCTEAIPTGRMSLGKVMQIASAKCLGDAAGSAAWK